MLESRTVEQICLARPILYTSQSSGKGTCPPEQSILHGPEDEAEHDPDQDAEDDQGDEQSDHETRELPRLLGVHIIGIPKGDPPFQRWEELG